MRPPSGAATVLTSPDDFAAVGLSRLWAALQTFADDDWGYSVSAFDRFLLITLEAGLRAEPFEGIHRLVRACDDDEDRYVIVRAHDGGGSRVAGTSNREWMFTSRYT